MGQRPLSSVSLRLSVYIHLLLSAIAIGAIAGPTFLAARPVQAEQRLLAMTGDEQPGGAGALLAGVGAPALNNAGEVVLQARLAEGPGGVGGQNDAALWFLDGSVRESLAWKGAGDLGDGASFASFAAASIADDGDVVFKGATDAGKQGFWRASRDGSRSTIALSATTGVPGSQLQNAQYQTFGFQLVHAPNDTVVYSSRLARGVGGVDNTNSRGVWRDVDGANGLLVRESISEVPDVPAAKFNVLSAESANNAGQTALLASMYADFGGVTLQDTLGIWRVGGAPGSDVLVARRGVGEPAGVAGGLFIGFSDLRINSGGAISYVGELQATGDVTAENNRGLWLYDGAANHLVARTAGEATGVAGGVYETLDVPLLNEAGKLLFAGGMKVGVGSVTGSTAKGVWIADGVAPGTLVARSGVGGVPGAPAAKFAEFGTLAFNGDGVAALSATLEVGAGGVASGNEQGLWLMDATGDGRLVARAGDVVAGRTVASLEFLGGSGGGDGRQRALNDGGQLAYKANFTNGDEAAFLYTPELDWRAASDGNWDDSGNWTLGISPSSVHQVELSTNSPTTVMGPSRSATVRRLQLGGGSAETTLEIPESGMLNVIEGLHLANNGKLAGKGTLAGGVVNAGSTSPGASTGVLAIDGNYLQQASGRLTIEIGGSDNSSPIHKQFDQLLVFGEADLGGALAVSLVNGFVPAIGDIFPILKATGGMTAFDNFELPMLPADRAWATTTSVDTLALSVIATTPASPADFNGDGNVDGNDLAAWQNGFGGPGAGDADGDGQVDGNDFLIWQRQFNVDGGAGPPASVPEPCGSTMGFAAILLGAVLRKRRLQLVPAA
ncbi:MAG: hypothetical protein JNL18_01800 [Planctomycetaceae bacterium]|nr:hypothetical protein [Planctomycetaceae bacterium]